MTEATASLGVNTQLPVTSFLAAGGALWLTPTLGTPPYSRSYFIEMNPLYSNLQEG